jgi:hypothetical protein
MRIDNFFAELKRRNVYKIALAYAVVAWLLVQTTSILFPTFDAPDTVLKNLSSKYATNGAYENGVIHALRKEPDEMFRWLDNGYAPTIPT